jgi:hypothetical protein
MIAAETEVLAGYQDERPDKTGLPGRSWGADMTTIESAQEIGAASPPATVAPVATIKARLADLWPPTMIAFGFVLTVIWTASLLGLLVVLLI